MFKHFNTRNLIFQRKPHTYYAKTFQHGILQAVWSFDKKSAIRNTFPITVVVQMSVPSCCPEFDLFSLGYYAGFSSSEMCAKKNANIRTKCKNTANSKTVANPADNEEGLKPFRPFLLQTGSFLQTGEKSAAEGIKSMHNK